MSQQGGINAPYTRLRGPLLVGQSSDFGVAAINGGSTAPLVSYWNASEHGMYVVSSAEVRMAAPGGDMWSYTSGLTKLLSTAASFSVANAIVTTSAAVGFLIIPQTTAAMSSGSVPTGTAGGVALVFEHLNTTGTGRLWAYSTISGWMASTTAFFTTTA